MSSPILIVSNARSGSTLLRYLLDSHPDITSPAESPLGTLCSMLVEFASQLPDELGDRGGEPAQDFLVAGRALIDDAMSEHAARRGKSNWCVKSLGLADRLPDIRQVFPDARFLCLHRHVMDQIASGLEAARWGYGRYGFRRYVAERPDNTVAALAQYWIDRTRAMIEHERSGECATLRVRYEDLATEPARVMTDVLRYLDLPRDPELVDLMLASALRAPHDVGYGDFKVDFASEINGSSIGRGRAVPVSRIEPGQRDEINELLRELDYEPLDGGWNTEPGPGTAPRAGLDKDVARVMAEVIGSRLGDLAADHGGIPAAPVGFEIAYSDGRIEQWVADPASREVTARPGGTPDSEPPGYRMRAEAFLEMAAGSVDFRQAVALRLVRRRQPDQGRDTDRLAARLFANAAAGAH
jgi:Sulfotransferase family